MAKSMYSFLPTDYVFNVWKLNIANDNYDLVTKLQYQDIINSSIELNSRGADILKLQIKNYDTATLLGDTGIDDVYLYERLIYQNPEQTMTYESEFNLFFWATKIAYTFERIDNILQTTFTVEAQDFKGYVEDYKFIQITTLANPGPQPVDNNGDLPYMFNKIQFPTTNGIGCNGTLFEVLRWIYKYNITEPQLVTKGENDFSYTPIDRRKVKGLDNLTVSSNVDSLEIYKTLKNKCTITDFLAELYDFYDDKNNNAGVYNCRPNIKMLSNNKIAVLIVKSRPYLIDNLNVNDEPIRYDYVLDKSTRCTSAICESNQNDTRFHEFFYGSGGGATAVGRGLSTRELLTQYDYDPTDDEAFRNHTRQTLYATDPIEDISLEIEFKNHIFLKDFTVNDRIQLINFNPDLLNTTLHILQLTEIIEDNYVSYAISKSQKSEIIWGKNGKEILGGKK